MALLQLHRRTPNRVSVTLLLAIALVGLAWLGLSTYTAPHFIASIYRGESLPIFNRMISGQSSHPLEEYLSDWNSFRWRVLLDFWLVGVLVVLALRPEFQRSLRVGTAPTPKYPVAASYSDRLFLALAIVAGYCLYLSLGLAVSPDRVHFFFDRYFFDPNDLIVYFNSSSWAVGKGKLYIDVRSEYPVLANLIFGFIRFFSSQLHLLSSSFDRFSLIWITCASMAFVCLLGGAENSAVPYPWLPLLVLAPATVYFSFFRFDIYAAVLSLWGLNYLRKRKWNLAALLFGVCVALKGYALIIIPTFFIFCWDQIGFGPAVLAAAIMLSPSLISNLAVFVWGGDQALLAPYKLQLFRKFNGESSFDSLLYLASQLHISQARLAILKSWLLENHIPRLIQSAVALAACSFRPRRFEDFVKAALLSVLGFITFSTFYSPQYVIWLIPFVLFTSDRVLLFLCVLLAWGSYIYFPVSYYSGNHAFFVLSVLAVTSIRFLMIARLIKMLLSKENCQGALDEKAPDFEGGLAGIA